MNLYCCVVNHFLSLSYFVCCLLPQPSKHALQRTSGGLSEISCLSCFLGVVCGGLVYSRAPNVMTMHSVVNYDLFT